MKTHRGGFMEATSRRRGESVCNEKAPRIDGASGDNFAFRPLGTQFVADRICDERLHGSSSPIKDAIL